MQLLPKRQWPRDDRCKVWQQSISGARRTQRAMSCHGCLKVALFHMSCVKPFSSLHVARDRLFFIFSAGKVCLPPLPIRRGVSVALCKWGAFQTQSLCFLVIWGLRGFNCNNACERCSFQQLTFPGKEAITVLKWSGQASVWSWQHGGPRAGSFLRGVSLMTRPCAAKRVSECVAPDKFGECNRSRRRSQRRAFRIATTLGAKMRSALHQPTTSVRSSQRRQSGQ